ncbi:MAG: helix-turn-helix domain-containing protein [Christensenellales bacterium]|jgi:transcriptional regulator with XRE-family HTH domain
MDCAKIGRLIAQLRKEKALTQQSLAQALNVSNKTVSKWECGLGCPDISLWADLSVILGAEISQLMEGEITPNRPDAGNIKKVRFYVCPSCMNVLTSTGGASIFCCGRKLEQLTASDNRNKPAIDVQVADIDYYITIDHEMTKESYILFTAYVKYDGFLLSRLYPEQSPSIRIPYQPGGTLYVYSTTGGLFSHEIARKR